MALQACKLTKLAHRHLLTCNLSSTYTRWSYFPHVVSVAGWVGPNGVIRKLFLLLDFFCFGYFLCQRIKHLRQIAMSPSQCIGGLLAHCFLQRYFNPSSHTGEFLHTKCLFMVTPQHILHGNLQSDQVILVFMYFGVKHCVKQSSKNSLHIKVPLTRGQDYCCSTCNCFCILIVMATTTDLCMHIIMNKQ